MESQPVASVTPPAGGKEKLTIQAVTKHFGDRLSMYALLVLLSALMLFYYMRYVPDNERKLNERGVRLLENKSRSIKEKYDAYNIALNISPVAYFTHWYFATHKK